MGHRLSVSLLLVSPFLLSGAGGESGSVPVSATPANPARSLPPVMRKLETSDNRVLQLPTTQSPQLSARQSEPTPPAAALPPKDTRPKPAPKAKSKGSMPEDFLLDSGAFCQKKIGHWTLPEARTLLGEPVRDRAAAEDGLATVGRIYAFRDPTARNREIELDFAGKSGKLRTVYVYPWRMHWAECTKLWGTRTSSLQANKGRTFYSYLDRRLDVLVAADGQVISVGMY